MSDAEKELLEYAARAHGGVFFHRFMNYPVIQTSKEKDGDPVVPWNPLTDDGDALRLAVKLNMTVRCYMGNTCAQIGVPGQPNAYCDESNHDDPSAATRRAIVRAAAEIGKAMPSAPDGGTR